MDSIFNREWHTTDKLICHNCKTDIHYLRPCLDTEYYLKIDEKIDFYEAVVKEQNEKIFKLNQKIGMYAIITNNLNEQIENLYEQIKNQKNELL